VVYFSQTQSDLRDQPEHPLSVQLHHLVVLLYCRSPRLGHRIPQCYPPDGQISILDVLSEILQEGQPAVASRTRAIDTQGDGVLGKD